MKKVFL